VRTSDEILIERVRDGDDAALRTLFERHDGMLRRRVQRQLPPALRRRVSTDDVLQEAHIVAFQRFGEFEERGAGAFAAWLGRIADLKVNEAIRCHLGTQKRGANREVSRGDRPDTAQFRGRGPTPSEDAIGRELRAAAERRLRELRPSQREILALIQADGLTLTQAALRMGRSYEATKKLYARALARLADLLDQDL